MADQVQESQADGQLEVVVLQKKKKWKRNKKPHMFPESAVLLRDIATSLRRLPLFKESSLGTSLEEEGKRYS